ncbi:muscarinic acetylcholine receptor M3-like isoform X2 [Acanthaster planci]|nr:muscarinic acetylcholine receptor M3-like isoform X2 [Acanthaster planci]XP_022088589.1 muscarinic acetylcholine receptor M3-like isoform X2 [Acanthaster planci]XP_022088590.1 muscarinic acetylcholine receptor M3-like isoform X2 [Acanthaster planci]XP_022088591.1 muscarinic acetylcholine receptor M3-like isoform X2 [Acanthaster planci]XP_022088592.1 muscarinic acetylcholine receptor M3-like isoform X2 [Acanthaster planci]XP_022088593.1 muscarinic acetylcholine receptor M3-like isoform X2 [A
MNTSNISDAITTIASTTHATTPDRLTPNGTPHSTVALVFICISALLSQILTIGGNILVMLSFRVERRLQKPSNYFLLSLAAADLIIGMFSMPIYTLYLIMGSWPFGTFVCDLWLSIDYSCSEVSVLNLIMISVDRLWSVRSPAKYRNKMNLRRAVIMIIPTWILPILLYFTSVLGWPYFHIGELRPSDECYVPFLVNSPLFMALSTVVVYWVPLTILFLMYAYIFRIIRNLSRKKVKSGHRNAPDESIRGRAMRSRVSHDHLYPERTLEPTMMESEALGVGITTDGTTTSTTVSALSAEANRVNEVKRKTPPRREMESYDRDDPSDETSSSERRRDNEQQQPLRHQYQPNSNGKKRSSIITFRSSGRKYEVKRRSVKGERQSRSERKATRTLTFILGAFFITWSPYSTVVMIKGYCPDCVPDALYHFSYYLCYINSTVNPLCYAFANELFRATFYKILTCKAFGRR